MESFSKITSCLYNILSSHLFLCSLFLPTNSLHSFPSLVSSWERELPHSFRVALTMAADNRSNGEGDVIRGWNSPRFTWEIEGLPMCDTQNYPRGATWSRGSLDTITAPTEEEYLKEQESKSKWVSKFFFHTFVLRVLIFIYCGYKSTVDNDRLKKNATN